MHIKDCSYANALRDRCFIKTRIRLPRMLLFLSSTALGIGVGTAVKLVVVCKKRMGSLTGGGWRNELVAGAHD